jgi:hypothetical protein
MEHSVDQQPPGLFNKRDAVLARLAFRPVEVYVNLSFASSIGPVSKRERDYIGDVIVPEETPIDTPNEPAPHKND